MPSASSIPAEVLQKLRAAGAVRGDVLLHGRASGEDAGLAPAAGQRESLEKVLPCLGEMRGWLESGADELWVACAAGAVAAVLAALLEQGFVDVAAHEGAFD